MNATLSVRECLSYGWQTFKKRPGFLILAGVLILVLHIVLSLSDYIPDPEVPAVTIVLILVSIVTIFLGFLIDVGTLNLMLRVHDNVEGAKLSDLWRPDAYWRYLGTTILMVLAVLAGLILLIIPGIIIAIALSFGTLITVDKGMRPVAALKESWRLTKGYRWKLFLLGLATILLNIVGALLLIVGLFVTLPVSFIASVHAYRLVEKGRTPELVPAL